MLWVTCFDMCTRTFALERAVLVDDGRHFKATDAPAVTALRLHVEMLALFVEEARLVVGGLCRNDVVDGNATEMEKKLRLRYQQEQRNIHLLS